MFDTLANFLSSESFMPHGHCYQWNTVLLWLQVGTNLAIGVSYIVIAAGLGRLVQRLDDPPFKIFYYAFAAFILTCGLTHFFDIWVIWDPQYWVDGGIRAVCAVASVATAAMIPTLLPKAESLSRSVRSVQDRGVRVEQAFEELASVHEKTTELEEQKTEFFANVSHELRTPLTLILGRADQLAETESLDEQSRQSVATIADNARVLLKHVNDLLDVASMDAGQMQLDESPFDLATRFRRTCSNFGGLAQDNDISFRVYAPTNLPVIGDPSKIESILLNLLSNAFKFTPDGGEIDCELWVDEDSGSAKIHICDSGPGVPAEHREKIFERFRQVDAESARRFGGTGLGLVVTRDFAELHGGDVSVEDSRFGGASFQVALPIVADDHSASQSADDGPRGKYQSGKFVQVVTRRVRENRHTPSPHIHDASTIEKARALVDESEDIESAATVEPSSTVEPSATVEPAEADIDGHPRVLVVEDTADMNDYISEILGQDAEVFSAFRGERALELASKVQPDIIVTDLIMPTMDGRELLHHVRDDDTLRRIPVLVITAKADSQTRTQLLREGAADFLQKPFLADELRSRTRRLIAVKRTRELLQRQLETKREDLQELAGELGQKRAELERAVETIELARDQSERASQLKSRFLGLVSHELRTPLTAFRLETELLQRKSDNFTDWQKTVVDRMEAAVNRLTDMIESLLQRAAIESGRLNAEPKRFDLELLCKSSVDELRAYAGRKDLELEVLSSPGLPVLESDPKLVRLILANLVGNAVKFTDSGTISVMLDATDEHHRIAVSDEGPGIEPEMQVQIFDAFEKTKSSTDKQIPGVGLGLALVRDMTLGLGGTIELESKPGEGSVFTVILPSRLADNPMLAAGLEDT